MDQQQHLKEVIDRRTKVQIELEKLQAEANSKRELFFKLQGIVEYLAQIGVTLPEEPVKEPVEEVSTEG